MTTELRPSTTTRFDDDHDLVFLGDQAAWLAERETGDRVSMTWTREAGESLDDFRTRVDAAAARVAAFISPGN